MSAIDRNDATGYHATVNPRVLVEADDVTDEVLAQIPDCLEWYSDRRTVPAEDFIDKFSDTYGYPEWELDNYDSPAARKILKEARRLKREEG